MNHSWDRSAWDLANLYLLSVGAKLLGKEAPRIVGIRRNRPAANDVTRREGLLGTFELLLSESVDDAEDAVRKL